MKINKVAVIVVLSGVLISCLVGKNIVNGHKEANEPVVYSTVEADTVEVNEEQPEQIVKTPVKEETRDNWEILVQDKEVLMARIKKESEEKWPGDYQMIEYEINTQTKSYNNMVSNIDSMDKDILNRSLDQWHADFQMVEYEYNTQMEAKNKIYGN